MTPETDSFKSSFHIIHCNSLHYCTSLRLHQHVPSTDLFSLAVTHVIPVALLFITAIVAECNPPDEFFALYASLVVR